MAALIKKRVLAEYCQAVVEESQQPCKRLQIIRRSRGSEHSEFSFSNLTTFNSDDLLLTLVNINNNLPIPNEKQMDVIQKLIELLQNPHSANTAVICVILDIMAKMATTVSVHVIFEEIVNLARRTSSQKILAHSINAVCRIAHQFHSEQKYKDQAFSLILQHISSANPKVKIKCIEGLGCLCPREMSKLQNTVMTFLMDNASDQDSRVRTASFKALMQVSEKNVDLVTDVYMLACKALIDDYQCVREAALPLIKIIAEKKPEVLILIEEGEHIRLCDHAFTQICNAFNDISLRVRVQAASIIGTIPGISEHFLLQTLDKKLITNMKIKRSAHEQARAMVSTGEWSSGKRWADDAPVEKANEDAIQMINNGACGAFVHGLEDEFLEKNPHFANQCLDFLVDMFNDEIEEIRLKAILVLQKIAHHIRLRPDQLEEILHALKDSWLDIRESLHCLLGMCKLSTTSCVMTTVTALLDNLRRYSQDRRSIHRCLKQLGTNHPELVLALVPQVLLIHPYFDGIEPSVQDGEYICKLILIFNAAHYCPTIIPLLEKHTLRHYEYLRDTMPLIVPSLKLVGKSSNIKKDVKTNTRQFLKECIEKLSKLENVSPQLKLTAYSTIQTDLINLADLDRDLSSAANFAALYTQCIFLMNKILLTRNWLSPSSLSSQQSGAVKNNVDQLLKNTFRLRHAFTNLNKIEGASIRVLRLRTLALQLVYVVHGSTGSALSLCDNFLDHTEALLQYLNKEKLQNDSFLESVLQELGHLDEPRPGAVARILQPLLVVHPVPPLTCFENPSSIQMSWAEILQPQPDSEVIHKLNAGLIVGIPLDAEVWNILEATSLRIKVAYPDQTIQLVVPSSGDLRKVSSNGYRLLTTVLISAQVWSEACQVGISLALDLSDQEMIGTRKHIFSKNDESSMTIQLCDQVKVFVWPKPIKKGI